MRAMALTEFGKPLELLDLPDPELRPDSVLLDVLGCGVCYSDYKMISGTFDFCSSLPLPHIPGHEVCGRVVATEPHGALEKGSLVVVTNIWPCGLCSRCRAGSFNLCLYPDMWMGFTDPGGMRERMVVPLSAVVPVPGDLDPLQVAPAGCAIGTAYRATLTRGQVAAGMRVAVLGLGGVGIHALQLADLSGARAVGLDVTEPALSAASELGLEAYRGDDESSEQRILEATGGEGVDVVIDAVGLQATLEQANRLVRKGGRIVGIGYRVDSDLRIPTQRFTLDEIELLGSRNVLRHELERVLSLLVQGKLRSVVGLTRALAEANDIFDVVAAGQVSGRNVVDLRI